MMVKHDQKEYISSVRRTIEMQEALLSSERNRQFTLNDHAWDSEVMKGK